jgi:hypothetical protein
VRHYAFFAAVALCAALPALAAGPNDQAAKRWKQADACIADANKQVPDHNAAAQRKRDQLTNDCMVAHKLPPLTNLAPADSAAPPAPAPTTPKAD